MKGFFDTELWKWIRTLLEIVVIGAIVIVIVLLLKDTALADEEQVWIMCDPESYVCIREKPTTRSNAFGGASFGTCMKTDGKEKNGFIHVVDIASEEENGWVSMRYIVYDEPEAITQKAIVASNGKLAARKGVNGKVQKWLKPMTEVMIYVRSNVWCITNYGYVQTEYLDYVGE